MTAGAAGSSRTFRVFVSSTFDDFVDERNALQRHVFPRLAELCESRGGRFQAIDLRWGVGAEAGPDQRTVAIHLAEIARCQRLTPRPNFIMLLGDRYGWRPLPSRIERVEFEAIRANVPGAAGPAATGLARAGSADKGSARTRAGARKSAAAAAPTSPAPAPAPAAAADSDRALLDRWYRLDENAEPAEYVLQPREESLTGGATTETRKAAQDAEAARWFATEARLRAILLAAVARLRWGDEDQRLAKYVASATEQEIVRGLLEAPGAHEHVFAFNRTIVIQDGRPLARLVPPDGSARAFLDETEVDGRWVPDTAAHDRLVVLKERELRPLLGANMMDYRAVWTGAGITPAHIGALPESLDACLELFKRTDVPHTLCNDVWRNLASAILAQLTQLEAEEAVEAEIAAQRRFGEARRSGFVGRDKPLEAISKYLSADERQPLAVIGEPGSGKSALMATAFERAETERLVAVTVVRSVGATLGSSVGRSLLGGLCREIARAYGGDESTVPSDYDDLAVDFGRRLELATAERPLIVFLDALDRLGAADPARTLGWLPAVLPDHVRLVVSTAPGDCEGALKARHPGLAFLTLDRMTRKEGDTALGQWLAGAGRRLTERQRKQVLDRFEPEGRPLYLKLAFEEARLWHSYDEPAAAKLGAGIPALIGENLFARLADSKNHGGVLVSHALGYLAASRHGLSEDELLDVLSADEAVKRDFHDRFPLSPASDRLPVAAWSHLYFDLEPYLIERVGDGAILLDLDHPQLAEAATGEFLAGAEGTARHAALASYFRAKADPAGDGTWSGGSVRGLGELPYHLVGADQPDELYKMLTDFVFLQRKVSEVGVAERAGADGKPVTTYGGVYSLEDDFGLALANLGGGAASGRKPLIVTAVDLGSGLMLGCPWCTEQSTFRQEWRGAEIACPECGGPLRVNEFVVGREA